MHGRGRALAPMGLVATALAVALAACGGPGAPGGAGNQAAGAGSPSAGICSPVADEQLVVLEDDRHLLPADDVVPAVTLATAMENPALLPALDAVSAALTTEGLIDLNAAVGIDLRRPEDVAAAWVAAHVDVPALARGSGPVVVGSGATPQSIVLAAVYAEALAAAGFDASVRAAGDRDRSVPALISGAEIQVLPDHLWTAAEFLNRQVNGPAAEPVASSDGRETLSALHPLAEQVGLVFGRPSGAAAGPAFAVSRGFAERLGIATLSDLAGVCGDGSLVLGGPPGCADRPFCGSGLEETYGLQFEAFQELDAGGARTRAALERGEVSIGLVSGSDAALARR